MTNLFAVLLLPAFRVTSEAQLLADVSIQLQPQACHTYEKLGLRTDVAVAHGFLDAEAGGPGVSDISVQAEK